jgi:hypothetical protein
MQTGPASRPSQGEKGGQSLWDPSGGEWRWFPGNKWHNPHWDYNPHDAKGSPWVELFSVGLILEPVEGDGDLCRHHSEFHWKVSKAEALEFARQLACASCLSAPA